MLVQLAIGSALIVVTILVAGAGFMVMEALLSHRRAWLSRPPHRPKLLILLCGVVLWILLIATAGVWFWAVTFLWLGLFETLEQAVYFALVVYTTLGYGDVLLPLEWRLLGGMSAINGLLMVITHPPFVVLGSGQGGFDGFP
ncbi:MAG: two pore domain potassium channel family protein [Rhodobacteraceae bacterium]|nr:two pore domain potassium channel family protein [Paracoccaceae bacterium]